MLIENLGVCALINIKNKILREWKWVILNHCEDPLIPAWGVQAWSSALCRSRGGTSCYRAAPAGLEEGALLRGGFQDARAADRPGVQEQGFPGSPEVNSAAVAQQSQCFLPFLQAAIPTNSPFLGLGLVLAACLLWPRRLSPVAWAGTDFLFPSVHCVWDNQYLTQDSSSHFLLQTF